MNHEEAANKLQESLDYMDSVFPAKRRQATIDLLDALRCGIAALRAEEEREKGCEYCTVNKELAETLQVDTLCAAFTKHTSEMKCLCRPLRYCPMCGRKLDGGGQDGR